jgi:hypothetical protein
MPGSFDVSKIWFAREAMPPLQRLTLGNLLRQFFPVTSAALYEKSEIPPTAVGGFLQVLSTTPSAEPPSNPTHGSGWISSGSLYYTLCRTAL